MMSRKILIWLMYGAGMGLTALLMAWVKYRLLVLDHATELYALFIGLVFVILGAWLGSRLVKPKTIVRQEVIIKEVAVPVYTKPDVTATPDDPGISQRELDVLRLLARGMSNEEIAAGLFVSQNTVKTHLSNLYFKLGVRRRIQAVDKARLLGLID
jgi:DNA-binding CsgD family transcriptional regulator